MGLSKDGQTLGITLRLKKRVFDVYATIANRQNAADLENGGRGLKTTQDVMREALESYPEVIVELKNMESSNN